MFVTAISIFRTGRGRSRLGAGDRKEKTIVLFVAVQGSEYDRFYADAGGAATFGGTDLSDIKLPCGGLIPVKEKAKYLGSMLNRDVNYTVDIDARISKASAMFGKMKPLIFKNKGISIPAKRAAYVAIVMSILLYGSEMWAISAADRRKLHSFHNRCARTICGISMWHVQHQRIKTQVTLEEANLRDIDTYMARRRLRWLGHVRRMDWGRVPRKLLSSWCSQVRPIGRPCLRWAESIEADLISARLPISKWHIKAEDREEWKNLTRNLGEPKSKIMKRKLKLRQQARQHGNQNQDSWAQGHRRR